MIADTACCVACKALLIFLQIAASAVLLTNHTLGRRAWSSTMQHYSSYQAADLELCTRRMQVGESTELIHCLTGLLPATAPRQASRLPGRSQQNVYAAQVLLPSMLIGQLCISTQCVSPCCRCSFAELVQETTPQPSGTSTTTPGRAAIEIECCHHQQAPILEDPGSSAACLHNLA